MTTTDVNYHNPHSHFDVVIGADGDMKHRKKVCAEAKDTAQWQRIKELEDTLVAERFEHDRLLKEYQALLDENNKMKVILQRITAVLK